ncbi:MAG: hypothetical protein ACI8RZ_006225 [Myxococcota bacterium]|jgi:hypothetical protein
MTARSDIVLRMLLLLACTTPDIDSGSPLTESAPVPLFTIAAVADPHLFDDGEHATRTATLVDWINDNAGTRGIELVVISGDIAWGAGLDVAPGLLNALTVPYVPVIGDNEIHNGVESDFAAMVAPMLDTLASQVEDWRAAPVPVDNPIEGGESWLFNYSFTYRDVRFVALDWNARVHDTILGEMADLHDFDGGTLPFLVEELALHGDGPAGGMILASHHPMHLSPGAFDLAEMEALSEVIAPHGDRVYADLAGHYHVDMETTEEAGYDVLVTDAIWDDVITIRLLEVSAVYRGEELVRFETTHERVTL